jgi:hypothetical protein
MTIDRKHMDRARQAMTMPRKPIDRARQHPHSVAIDLDRASQEAMAAYDAYLVASERFHHLVASELQEATGGRGTVVDPRWPLAEFRRLGSAVRECARLVKLHGKIIREFMYGKRTRSRSAVLEHARRIFTASARVPPRGFGPSIAADPGWAETTGDDGRRLAEVMDIGRRLAEDVGKIEAAARRLAGPIGEIQACGFPRKFPRKRT